MLECILHVKEGQSLLLEEGQGRLLDASRATGLNDVCARARLRLRKKELRLILAPKYADMNLMIYPLDGARRRQASLRLN